MTESKPFAVGDIVCVTGGWTPSAPRNVIKVMKKYVVLDDKSKWTQWGAPYPRAHYARERLVHDTPELREQYRRYLYRSKLDAALKDARLDAATLNAALLVLQTALSATEDA
jgi:hypothetical protein